MEWDTAGNRWVAYTPPGISRLWQMDWPYVFVAVAATAGVATTLLSLFMTTVNASKNGEGHYISRRKRGRMGKSSNLLGYADERCASLLSTRTISACMKSAAVTPTTTTASKVGTYIKSRSGRHGWQCRMLLPLKENFTPSQGASVPPAFLTPKFFPSGTIYNHHISGSAQSSSSSPPPSSTLSSTFDSSPPFTRCLCHPSGDDSLDDGIASERGWGCSGRGGRRREVQDDDNDDEEQIEISEIDSLELMEAALLERRGIIPRVLIQQPDVPQEGAGALGQRTDNREASDGMRGMLQGFSDCGKYRWMQGEDQLTLVVPLPRRVRRSDVSLAIASSSLSASVRNCPEIGDIGGTFVGEVDAGTVEFWVSRASPEGLAALEDFGLRQSGTRGTRDTGGVGVVGNPGRGEEEDWQLVINMRKVAEFEGTFERWSALFVGEIAAPLVCYGGPFCCFTPPFSTGRRTELLSGPRGNQECGENSVESDDLEGRRLCGSWKQTEEYITLTLPLPEGTRAHEIDIDFSRAEAGSGLVERLTNENVAPNGCSEGPDGFVLDGDKYIDSGLSGYTTAERASSRGSGLATTTRKRRVTILTISICRRAAESNAGSDVGNGDQVEQVAGWIPLWGLISVFDSSWFVEKGTLVLNVAKKNIYSAAADTAPFAATAASANLQPYSPWWPTLFADNVPVDACIGFDSVDAPAGDESEAKAEAKGTRATGTGIQRKFLLFDGMSTGASMSRLKPETRLQRTLNIVSLSSLSSSSSPPPSLSAPFFDAPSRALLGDYVDEEGWQRLERLAELLLEWNQSVNLVSRRDPESVIRRQILGALAILPCLHTEGVSGGWGKRQEEESSLDAIRCDNGHGIVGGDTEARQIQRVLDIGTGGGFPGLPLACARPEFTFVLCDSRKNKTTAVADMVARLGLGKSVSVTCARAETLEGEVRAGINGTGFDVVVGRAVTNLPDFMSWAVPLLRGDGQVVYMRGLGGNHFDEVDALGVEPASAHRVADVFNEMMAENFGATGTANGAAVGSLFDDDNVHVLRFDGTTLRLAAARGGGRK